MSRSRRRTVGPGPSLTGLLLTGLLLTGLPLSTAVAAPADDARARAAALRTQVDGLQVQAEQASEAYDAAYDELGRAVGAHLAAQRALAAAQASAGLDGAVASRRVRALYMAGGPTGLYASVLRSADLGEALRRLHQVDAVVAGDRRVAARATTAAADRAAAEAQLAAAARSSVRLQAAVSRRGDAVRAVLARTGALLDQADEQVRVLADEQRAQLEAAAADQALAELARAQAVAQAVAQAQTVAQGHPLPVVGPPSARVATALAFARAQLGKPYLWGATGPGSYDCSGLTGAAYAAAGITLPRTASQQWYAGPQVPLADLQPGDLLFWASDTTAPATIHHEAIYLGAGQMLAAPHSGAFVRVQPLYLNGYIGAVRPTGSA